jgi:hypothetical protein
VTWSAKEGNEGGCHYTALTEAMARVGREIAPIINKRRRKSWFELSKAQLVEVIAKRNKATAQYRSYASDDNKIVLKSARSAVKTAVKESKLRWVSVRINEIDQYKMEPRHAWVAVRELNEMFSGHHRKSALVTMQGFLSTMALSACSAFST